MLKDFIIPSATTVERSAAEQEDLQPYKKTKTSLFFAK